MSSAFGGERTACRHVNVGMEHNGATKSLGPDSPLSLFEWQYTHMIASSA